MFWWTHNLDQFGCILMIRKKKETLKLIICAHTDLHFSHCTWVTASWWLVFWLPLKSPRAQWGYSCETCINRMSLDFQSATSVRITLAPAKTSGLEGVPTEICLARNVWRRSDVLQRRLKVQDRTVIIHQHLWHCHKCLNGRGVPNALPFGHFESPFQCLFLWVTWNPFCLIHSKNMFGKW